MACITEYIPASVSGAFERADDFAIAVLNVNAPLKFSLALRFDPILRA
jgi:hypothetical protein